VIPESYRKYFMAEEIDVITVGVRAEGLLAGVGGAVSHIGVPADDLQVLDPGDLETAGVVTFRDALGDEQTLAAAFSVGQGEIIVVGDATLCDNVTLAVADNSVLAAHLFAGPASVPDAGSVRDTAQSTARPVIFDEFYHGLSVRGNPFWLLTRPAYAMLTAAVLALIGLWTWRQAVLLGPPLTTAEPSRRAIGEYVEAMARFLHHGRKTRPFLLQAVYQGALWQLQHELTLPASKPDVEHVAAALARRHPERAERLRAAAAAVDAALAKGDNCGEKEAIQAMRGMAVCLASRGSS
jgi:pimeloyl-ACP methyl ester carboxylesterase